MSRSRNKDFASVFLLRLVIASLAMLFVPTLVQTQAADIQRYNIYTMDTTRPGRGDLTSNWVVARYLREQKPQAEINIYISPIFHDRFIGVEPAFAPSDEVQQIVVNDRNINVYSRTNPELHATENVEAAAAKQRAQLHQGNVRTCNLAFTVDKRLHLTRDIGHPQVSTDASSSQVMAALGSKAFTARILDDTKLKLARFRAAPITTTHATPFLSFSTFTSRDTRRLAPGVSDIMLDGSGDGLYPLFGVYSGFNNRMAFIQTGEPNTPEIRTATAAYTGFAHAFSEAAIVEYIDNIERLANMRPTRNFVVFVTRRLSNRKGQVSNNKDWPILFTQYDSLVNKIVAMESDPEQLRISRLGENRNLAVLEFTRGLPMDVTDAVIRGANLRILVTGTMSLSQGLQYAKPFVYEAREWHDMISYDIGRYLSDGAGNQFHYTIIPPPASKILNQFSGKMPAADRLSYAYGVSANQEADWGVYERNYQRDRVALTRYRDEQVVGVPKDTYGQLVSAEFQFPTGHLLDNVVAYCSRAADTLDEFVRRYNQRSTCEKCLSTGTQRRAAAKQIIDQLSIELETHFQTPP